MLMRSLQTRVSTVRAPRLSRHDRRGLLVGLLFISPWIVGFLGFQLYPFLASLYYSFTSYQILGSPHWIGLVNYHNLAADPRFHSALFNSAYYAVFAVPLDAFLGFLLALLLNQKMVGRPFFRTIFFLPSITPLVATALIWLWMFNPDSGIVNSLLSIVGIHGPGWLGSPEWSKPALIIMSLWRVGTSMLIFLAALQDVPRELLEAAQLDGANKFQQTRHITLPMISPIALFIVVTGLIAAVQFFTEVQVMTGGTGSPADSTLMISIYLWQTAFQSFNMGYAAAQAWILFALIIIFTALLFRITGRHVYYGG